MKVLLIMGAAGGVGRHVTDLAYYLLKSGHVVTLIYSRTRTDSYINNRLSILELNGCEILDYKFNRRIGFKDLLVAMSIVRLTINSQAWDVIHGHSSKGGLYARVLYFCCKAKIIYSPHAFYTMNQGDNKFINFAIRLLEYLMSFLTYKIITTSKKEMEHLSYLWISENKASLISNGSYNSPFDVALKLPLHIDLKGHGGNFTIGFVGRFCYQKNLDLVIEIFSNCLLENRNLKLLMVGSGDDESRIKSLVTDMGLGDKVIFLGEVNCDDVMPLFDLLLVTSRYEGSPYLFQDAVKHGVPVISTDVGGVEFFVKNNKNGFVFDSPKNAVKSIIRLVESPDLLKKFSNESNKIAKYYSWSRMGNAVLKLYESSKGHFR